MFISHRSISNKYCSSISICLSSSFACFLIVLALRRRYAISNLTVFISHPTCFAIDDQFLLDEGCNNNNCLTFSLLASLVSSDTLPIYDLCLLAGVLLPPVYYDITIVRINFHSVTYPICFLASYECAPASTIRFI